MSVFPEWFWWGAATAAYQIEGAATEGGRTKSIWDTFAATPGRVSGGDTGDIACDHYHRYRDDVRLMAALGLAAYRFSVSWPRIHPRGSGRANPAGLAFYDRLVDELLAAGILPVLTLYHWDLPQELEDIGGWANRETAVRFAEYAQTVGNALGDRVALWSTLNEPWCSAFLGYGSGEHAPGRTDPESALIAAHHLLLGHGLATQALRANLPTGSPVSIVLNLGAIRPASGSVLDLDAARRIDALQNRLFLDALLRGRYPDDLLADTVKVSDWSFVRAADLSIISTEIDVLGLNYYGPSEVGIGAAVVRDAPQEPSAWPGSEHVVFSNPGFPVTDMGWPVDADGLMEILTRVRRDYGDVAMMVTENGAAYADVVDSDGILRDHDRVNYLREHIAAAGAAIEAGVDLRGYFVWSLLDNFEWAWGYAKRFGIIHVDYATQQRTWKDSALWYQQFLATGELT